MFEPIQKVLTNPIVRRVAKIAYSKAPAVMLTAGVGCICGGTILVALKSKKAYKELDNVEKLNLTVDEYAPTEEDAILTKRRNNRIALKNVAMIYAGPAALVLTGVGLVIGAHHIQARRLVILGTAYNTLLAGFNEYRAKVIADQGFEKDQLYFGAEEVEVEKISTNKNGKETKKKGTIMCPGTGDTERLYHRCYDIYNSTQWANDPVYNLTYLKAQEQIFNNKLHAYGYVFLDEVYEALGFSMEDHSNAKLVGWLDDGTGDSFVDFGIFNPDQPQNIRFVEGYEPNIWLNFNCDGVIIDKI